MKLQRRQFLHLAAGAAALPALSRIANAQAYPSRPITIMVPFGPGSATAKDVAIRVRGKHPAVQVSRYIPANPGVMPTVNEVRAAFERLHREPTLP